MTTAQVVYSLYLVATYVALLFAIACTLRLVVQILDVYVFKANESRELALRNIQRTLKGLPPVIHVVSTKNIYILIFCIIWIIVFKKVSP